MFTSSALVLMSLMSFTGKPAKENAPMVQPGRRISGATTFLIPSDLIQEMERASEGEIDYRGTVCVGADGVPRSIKAVERTGVRDADKKVEKTVMSWRYAPLRVAGRPVAFCAAVRYRFEVPDAGLVNPMP